MFKIIHKSKISKARIGIIQTPHGSLETPIFIPDATRGVVKHLSNQDLDNLGLPSLVANALHLFLRPGAKLIRRAHGLHNFMNWQKPILTDSGGYQVFSLIHKNGRVGSINDRGVIFNFSLDGAKITMTPELSIKTQFALGADMMVCFDDCPPNGYHDAALSISVERTIKWAKRCKREYDKQVKSSKLLVLRSQGEGGKVKSYKRPLLFAVIQGGDNLPLRQRCSEELIKTGFDGFGFGARHIDESGNFLAEALEYTAEKIPENKLRFGLGIGRPEDIIKSIKLGWDMFDCVIPTREGRHGKLFMFNRHAGANPGLELGEAIASRDSIGPPGQKPGAKGAPSRMTKTFYETINITNAKFAKDFSPINEFSQLAELRRYSKAYLNYLFKINESLALRLASLNNIEFYLKMISEVKELIKKNKI